MKRSPWGVSLAAVVFVACAVDPKLTSGVGQDSGGADAGAQGVQDGSAPGSDAATGNDAASSSDAGGSEGGNDAGSCGCPVGQQCNGSGGCCTSNGADCQQAASNCCSSACNALGKCVTSCKPLGNGCQTSSDCCLGDYCPSGSCVHCPPPDGGTPPPGCDN